MEEMGNGVNGWGQMMETDVVGPVKKSDSERNCGSNAKMKSGNATGPSEVNVEMIVASDEIGIKVMMDLCQRVLDGREMTDKGNTSAIVSIFKGKGDVMSCG